MARSIFFSFHYQDVSSFRANVVRNSWVTMRDTESKFIDKSLWEEAQGKGSATLKQLIDTGMKGTSVTAVLVGSQTWSRRWVKYEIIKSFVTGKGIIPVHINRISSRNQGIIAKGPNPLERLALWIDDECKTITFYELKEGKWILFKDFPTDNNRKTNSFYFEDGWFNKYKGGRFYNFSNLFTESYDWVRDDGYKNFSKWVENAAFAVGR